MEDSTFVKSLGKTALFLVLAGWVASCSSTSPKPTPPTTAASAPSLTSGAATGSPSCATVPASTVSVDLGVTVSGPVVRPSGTSASCSYSSGSFRAAVVITVTRGATSESFAADAAKLGAYGATTTTISDLGDSAMASALGTGPDQTNTVAVLSGSTEVTITAAAALARIEALAQTVLAQL